MTIYRNGAAGTFFTWIIMAAFGSPTPSAGWLRDNGRDPLMVKGVEFTDVRNFEAETKRMPNFTLHELAHAYHDQVLPRGFGNAEIKAAFERAKASKTYDKVERWLGNG